MFGNRLRTLRTSRRLSRQTLAETMGVSITTIYKWENGFAQPNIQAMGKLADLFGVTMDELCDYHPTTYPEQDARLEENLAVMTRAFRQLRPEEREKYMAVGRALFAHAFEEQEPAPVPKEVRDEPCRVEPGEVPQ